MCRPGYGSRKKACPGGHIGPPLRSGEAFGNQWGSARDESLPQRDGTEPAPCRGAEQGGLRRGVVTPPYGGGTEARHAGVVSYEGTGGQVVVPYGWFHLQ